MAGTSPLFTLPNTAHVSQEEDDMSSQLNPNAAEFVPVSPTRLLMLDDAIISASSYHHDESIDEVKIPTEHDFDQEIAQRPGDREYSSEYKQIIVWLMLKRDPSA